MCMSLEWSFFIIYLYPETQWSAWMQGVISCLQKVRCDQLRQTLRQRTGPRVQKCKDINSSCLHAVIDRKAWWQWHSKDKAEKQRKLMKIVTKYRCVRRNKNLKRQRMWKHWLVLCLKSLTAFLCIDKDNQLHMRNGVYKRPMRIWKRMG